MEKIIKDKIYFIYSQKGKESNIANIEENNNIKIVDKKDLHESDDYISTIYCLELSNNLKGKPYAISLINTITGMKIDIERRKFVLANKTGGMSGPAIKPVAVRMVYQCAQAVKIPIIGMGGIMTAEDAIEFMMAGATAVSVGAANFINPTAMIDVIDGIETYLNKHNIEDINEIIGCVQ